MTVSFYSVAQKELWGVYTGNYNDQNYGLIGKYDINGENGTIIHQFYNDNFGANPVSRLIQASNGKLYGTTSNGGSTPPFFTEGLGVLFEYDLILNKYRVLYSFENDNDKNANLIEISPNLLIAGFRNIIYKYDIQSETVTFLPGYLLNAVGDFELSSNGFIYSSSMPAGLCPSPSPSNQHKGAILKVNSTNNTFQSVYNLNCDDSDGVGIASKLLEVQPNKLFGICQVGGLYYDNNTADGYGGTLFEFNTQTNTFTKKIDFDNINLGKVPTKMIDNGNGKLYGICYQGGDATADLYLGGTLFEYTIATNTISKLVTFGFNPPLTFTQKNPIDLIKTSNGFLVGVCQEGGTFKFNPIDNTIVANFFSAININNLTEICRKPSYKEFVVNTYTPEVGSTFTFDLHNDNATSFVWKKGTTILPSQTSGVLNIANITLADTGVYTCTMTNECGETVTMNLNINVTNLATETIDDYKKLISLYPNPTKGIINLKFPENRGLKGVSYKITNFLGQTIVEHAVVSKPNITELSIDTSSFSTGVYQLSFTTDKGNWYGKFVKE